MNRFLLQIYLIFSNIWELPHSLCTLDTFHSSFISHHSSIIFCIGVLFQLKCHQYWPIDEGHTMLFGPIRVTLKSLVVLSSWVKRVMHVQHNDVSCELLPTCTFLLFFLSSLPPLLSLFFRPSLPLFWRFSFLPSFPFSLPFLSKMPYTHHPDKEMLNFSSLSPFFLPYLLHDFVLPYLIRSLPLSFPFRTNALLLSFPQMSVSLCSFLPSHRSSRTCHSV